MHTQGEKEKEREREDVMSISESLLFAVNDLEREQRSHITGVVTPGEPEAGWQPKQQQ